jgi:hypothetical protein
MDLSRRALTALVSFCLWLCALAFAAPNSLASTPIYSYIDDSGVQTFTNQFESIPEQYRAQVQQREIQASSPAATPPSSADDPPDRPAESRMVSAGGEYRMSDHDTRDEAVRLAVEAAKKDALEQVATYLESVTEVKSMDVTRDDIRSFTAGIVRVVDQKITTRLEHDTLVIRADLTAEIDPQEVIQAINALRENENARQELMALRAETDRLQEQLDLTSRALAAAPSPDEAQELSRQRDEMLNELQANALVSQAWTSWAYPAVVYSYPWIGMPGINGLLLQAQRIYPRHRHLPLAQQTITPQIGTAPVQSGSSTSPPSLLVAPPQRPHAHHVPPLLTPQGTPAKVGDIVVMPTPRSVPPVIQQSVPAPPQAQPYQLHPSHFWRPSPPNIHTAPSLPSSGTSVSPQRYSGGHRHYNNGGGRSWGGFSRGGGRGGGRGR